MSQPLRYMAREQDATTELYYVRARWYDPEQRRFISQDPIGLEGGINPYAYVSNDPINATDPSGLYECPVLQQSNLRDIGMSDKDITTGSVKRLTQPLRYAAREYDAETGLYYVRARYYDPVTGRFVSEDPIGTEGGLNTYLPGYFFYARESFRWGSIWACGCSERIPSCCLQSR